MKPIHSTFSAGAKAKLILVKNQPMLSITEANGKVITIHPKQSALLYFGLEKEHSEMLAWLEEESVFHALHKLEQEFVSSHSKFSIITAPLLFATFKPQVSKLLVEKKPVSRRAN
jgi:hypothetical protein